MDRRVVPGAVVDLLRQAEHGSGGCLILERGERSTALVDTIATEAARQRIDVRSVVGSPALAEPCEAVRALLDLAPDCRTGGGAIDIQTLRALARRVDELCLDAPLLIVVDHAELVDGASARFLSYLARNLEARSVSVLLVAVEVAEGSWLDELGVALGRGPQRVPDDAGPDADEVAKLLAELGDDERRVVEALAVLGPSPSVAALGAVAGESPELALQTLDRLFDWGLIRRTSTGAGHLLVAAIVLDDMAPTRRSELHGRAAEHSRAVGEAVEHVAAHLEHATPGSHPWAAKTLRAAANRALAGGDAHRAVGWLQRAVEEDRVHGLEVTLPVLHDLARAQERAGDPGATSSLRLAAELATGRERRTLQLRLARHLAMSSRLDEAVDVLDELMAGLDPDHPADHDAVVEVRTAIAATCRLSLHLRERSASLLQQLVPDPEAPLPDDPSLLAELAYEHALAGTDRALVVELGRRAMRSVAGGTPVAMAGQALFVALVSAEDLEGALLLCERLHGDARLQPLDAHRRGSIALAEGDVDRAVAWSRMAVADIEWVAPLLVPGARAQLGRALLRQGDLDGAAVALQLPGGKGRWRQHVTYHPLLLGQAELAAAAGDWWRASLFAADCAEFSQSMGTHNPAVVPWQPVAVRALVQLDRTDEARAILDDAIARAEGFGAPSVLAQLSALRRDVEASGGRTGITLTPVDGADVELDAPATQALRSLRLLGDTALVLQGVEHRLRGDLVDRAVCIVALEEGGIHDEQLAEALWPDGDPAVGRTRLRNVLARVRQRYGEVVVRSGRSLHLAADVEVDVRSFDRLAAEALSAEDDDVAERLGVAALDLYRGELCPSHPFEAWATAPRLVTRQRWLALLDRLADTAARRGDIATAMSMFEQAVAAEPWDEDRYLDAVERLHAAGRPAAARALLGRSEAMCAELGVPPSARHVALASALACAR